MSIARARFFRKHMSPPEARLWNLLRSEPLNEFHVRRQVPLGPYYADFASHRARLVIEVDGATHATDQSIAHDNRRTAFIESHGYRVIRFGTSDILGRLDDVAMSIGAYLDFGD